MKIGDLVHHPEKGLLTITRKNYRRLGNRMVFFGNDENGTEHELDGTEESPEKFLKERQKEEEQALKEAQKLAEKEEKEAKREAEKQAKEAEKEKKENESRQSEVRVVREIISKFETAKGNPGNDGYTPERGKDYWTENDKKELIDEIWKKVVIPTPKDGITPEAGIDYPSYQEVQTWVEDAVASIPRPKEVDLVKVADAVLKMVVIPAPIPGAPGKDGSPDTPENIKEKLESLKGDDRLDARAIKNLPKTQIGGGHGPNSLKHLEDVNISSPTNGQTISYQSSTGKWVNSSVASGSGHTIQDEGTPLTARTNLNFVGAGVAVTDDAGNDATVVTISSGGSGGDVSKVGTPVNNQVGVWTGDGTIEGDTALTFDTATDTLSTGIVTVTDEAYGAGWNGSLEVPTKNAVYDKLELFAAGTGIDHSGLTGLGDDDHTQYAFLAGRAAGQVLYGGTAANGDLTIEGTSHATKTTSYVILQPTSGNVGIGTSSPLAALDVNGVTRALSSAGTAPTGGTGLEYFYKTSTDTGNIYSYDRTNSVYKDLNLNDKLRIIGSTGNVGIGTTSPNANLVISDTGTGTTLGQLDTNLRLRTQTATANAGNEISFMGSGGAALGNDIYASIAAPVTANTSGAAGYLSFNTKATSGASSLSERMRITGAGNVGIGTTSPTAVLHLKAGTATANTAPLKLTSGTLNTTPEPGAVEFLTDKFYGTITTGAARQTFATLESAAQTFSNDVMVPDEAYGAGWNGSLEVPTKNAVYDKIEALSVGSGITRTVVVTSGSITLGATASTDYVYFVAGAHTLSMPSPNTNRYTIKNNHSANITVDTAGAELIEGAASISIAPQEAVDILSDGTNWLII